MKKLYTLLALLTFLHAGSAHAGPKTSSFGGVQSLTTTGSSGASTLSGGVLNVPVYSGGGGSSAFSGLTASTTANTLDNLNFANTWNWSTLTTGTGLTISDSGLTSGTELALSGTTTGAGKAFSSTITGASNTGYAGFFSNSSNTGYAEYASGIWGTSQASAALNNLFTPQLATLPNWRACLAKVKNKIGSCTVACVGDSTMRGFYSNGTSSGDQNTGSICTQFTNALNANGYNASTQNFIGAASNGGDAGRMSFGSWAASGGLNNLGGQVIFASATTASPATFTPNQPVDTCKIIYFHDTGTFSYSIDGGAPTNVDSNAAPSGYNSVTVTASTVGTHTWKLLWVSGLVAVEGFQCFDSTTPHIDVLNLGWSGSTTASWVDTTGGVNDPAAGITFFAPVLSIVDLGINEWVNSTGTATAATNLTSLITTLKRSGSSDVVYSTPNPSNSATYAQNTQQGYVTAMLASANAAGIPVIDEFTRMGTWTSTNALGLAYDDLHMKAAGYTLFANDLAQLLIDGPNSQFSQQGTSVGSSVLNYRYGVNYPFNDTTYGGTLAIGPLALSSLASSSAAYGAVAIGYNALGALTTGINNVAIGFNAGSKIVTDSATTSVGYSALQNQAIGNSTTGGNTAFGYQALSTLTTQLADTAVGYQALTAATVGSGQNTAYGYQAGSGITSGTTNTALGAKAGTGVTTGTANIFVGAGAGTGVSNLINTVNIGNGVSAGAGNSVVIGIGAVGSTGTSEVIIGRNAAAAALPAGNSITVLGDSAKAGDGGTAIGSNAMAAITTGGNTAVGSNALASDTSGPFNTAVGVAAGQFISTGGSNTAVGWASLLGVTGTKTTGANNTAVGAGSLQAAIAGVAQNTALGSTVLNALTTGSANTAVGYNSGLIVTTGSNNTILGAAVGSTVLTVGTNDILIGTNNAITATTSAESNAIHIGGTGGDWVFTTGTNTNTTANTIAHGVWNMPDLASSSAATTGTVCWTTSTGLLNVDTTVACLASLEELKDIQPGGIQNALSTVLKLKPFWYSWKSNTPEYQGDTHQMAGLGAHQVESVDKRLVGYGLDGELKGVKYQNLTAVLVSAIQEQQKEIDALKTQIRTRK